MQIISKVVDGVKGKRRKYVLQCMDNDDHVPGILHKKFEYVVLNFKRNVFMDI